MSVSMVVDEAGTPQEFSVLFTRPPPEGQDSSPTPSIKLQKSVEQDSASEGEDDVNDQAALIPHKQQEEDEGESASEANVLQLIEPSKNNTSSIGGASFNFINSIIGSGIIGIPSALRQAGFASGVLLLILAAIVTDYTVLLLIKDGIIANKFTYQEMVTAAFGRPGYWFLTVAQFLVPFTAMAAYTIIVGDTFSRIMWQLFNLLHDNDPPTLLLDPRFIKLLMVLLVMTPISLLRNISKLEKFSAFAVLCITFIVGVTVYEATHLFCAVRCFQPSCCESPFTTWVINKDILPAFGIMTSAFVCHHNTYLIYDSLKQRSHTRFTTVSHTSVSISFVFCLVLGLAGFITFMGETQGDLLNNYCSYDPVANITRLLFACVIMLTYPIECFVAREVLEIALYQIPYKAIGWIPLSCLRKGLDKFLYTPRHASLPRHVTLTFLLIAGALAIGVSTNDLGVVLAFSGCFTAVPLAYILPTASYLKLSKTPWLSRGKVASMLVVVFGLVVMFLGTIQATFQAVQSYSKQEEYDTPYCHDPSSLDSCCDLLQATSNFTLSLSLCSCGQFCSNFTAALTADSCSNQSVYF